MGWVASMLQQVAAAEATAYVATGVLPRKDSEPPAPLKADECYVELFVDALWLPKSRKLTSEMHGVVHVYSEFQRLGEGMAQIAFVSAPSDLAKVDGAAISKVVTRSRQALGPVPWRGDSLGLEIGLFSVKSSDLARPYLDLLDTLSKQAGINFIADAAPFVPVVRKGMELLMGRDGAHSLEVGLDATMTNPLSGSYALVAADRDEVREDRLSVAGDGTLLLDGALLRDYPWLVFRIRQTTERPDFGSIPELKARWSDLIAAIRSRKRADAEMALANFRVHALTSPDLITRDASVLIQRAHGLMVDAFSGLNQNAGKGVDLPSLAEVKLYPLQ